MSGGGFFGNNNEGSQPSSNGVKKPSVRTVRALLVSQVVDAPMAGDDGPVLIDENPVDQAVLCVKLTRVEDLGNSKRLEVNDTTGATEIRYSGNIGGQYYDTIEEYIDKNIEIYGHFRIFQGKVSFEVARVSVDVHPYQPLYHEVEAAREWYHYNDLISLDASLKTNIQSQDTKPEELFIDDSEQLKLRIVDIVTGKDGNEEGASLEFVAQEMAVEESRVKQLADKLMADGILYEVDGSYRISEM